VPIKHQFEQLTNANYLDKLGYGVYSKKIDAISLRKFIKNAPYYKTKLEKHKYQDKKHFLKRLDEKITELIEQFKER
jgi:UDP-N-acetylglucosamine:LPS N-acetylglucosamine transferase